MKFFHYIGILLIFISCSKKETGSIKVKDLVAVTRVELGRKLFFDPILSEDKSISCSSCHQPQFAYADNKAFSLGVNDSIGLRNTPSVMNMAFRPYFFYDGRAPSLEAQAIVPIEHPLEMNLSLEDVEKRLRKNKTYHKLFEKIYQAEPNTDNITNALAAFQMSLESDGSSAYDQWNADLDLTGFSASAERGRVIFTADESKCFECHFSPDFTGDEFRNIGLYDGVELLDKGRYDITKDSSDIGKFKVPGLRNVALTAPYMHNGMMKTLEEVIDFYSNPYDFVKDPINIDTLMIEPLNFTEQEKEDLINFLEALTDKNIPYRDE